MSNVIVTGAAGFIGYHLCDRLLSRGDTVLGIDSLTDYYDVTLKRDRLARLTSRPGFHFEHSDIATPGTLHHLTKRFRPDGFVNLAAQVGVRYSLERPESYISANLVGFGHVLEACRVHSVRHLVFASSSSVYGGNTCLPYSEHDSADHPVSLYAATKRANELMAHSYAHLFGIPCTGLRFFTVYGPWGRPDMAPMLFTRKILSGQPLNVFNNGNMYRDFTYVGDVAEAIVRVLDTPASSSPRWDSQAPDLATSSAPYRIYNVGNSDPVLLSEFISMLESRLGIPSVRTMLDMQPGDVHSTYANTSDLERDFGFRPATPLASGLDHFIAWYRSYYG